MNRNHDLCQNALLAALPEDDRHRLSLSLELVPMTRGQSVYTSTAVMKHVYFPTTAIVALLCDMGEDDGSMAEIAVIGDEGFVGISLFMSGEKTLSRAVVESAGYGYRLKGTLLKSEFQRAGPMQGLLLRYTQALLAEMAQTLACTRHHSLDQQFCRWLLMRFDRTPASHLSMSQEHIASIFGVRRAAISELAVTLRKAGLIEYNRGRIALLDRPGLESRVCECYAVIKAQFEKLLTNEKC